MKRANQDDAASTIINPFYAIVLKDDLFGDHLVEGAKEDWARHNAQLIEEFGSRQWLTELLTALSPGAKPEYMRDTIINPYKGIIFSERLKGNHEPIIPREQWVGANVKLMKELGVGEWLWQLLEVLETGGLEDPS